MSLSNQDMSQDVTAPKNLPQNIVSGTYTNWKVVQPKHNNTFNNVTFATSFGYSNHHQADISVHGHDMFSATVWDPTLLTFDV